MSCTVGNSYIVKAGDTLFIIAEQQLGDGNRWREIKKPDGTPFTDADATNLQVGQEICISNGVGRLLPTFYRNVGCRHGRQRLLRSHGALLNNQLLRKQKVNK